MQANQDSWPTISSCPRSHAKGRRRAAPLSHLLTPDRRYLIVRGRLWRASNPHLSTERKEALVSQLMDARRLVKAALAAKDAARLAAAREAVHSAKVALGERGPVWWSDDSPDFNRYLVKNSPYAAWYEMQQRD